jgi:hypothetical protein
MPYPKCMGPPHTDRVVDEAKLMLLMPGATALTRALTATILASYGLLNTQATAAVPSGAAVRQKAAVSGARAAELCHAVHHLCAQAVVLRREAEELCKSRR